MRHSFFTVALNALDIFHLSITDYLPLTHPEIIQINPLAWETLPCVLLHQCNLIPIVIADHS